MASGLSRESVRGGLMVQGNRMRHPGKDDYLLRYQVEIDPIGCSTVRWYCHRNPTKGLERERQVGGEGKGLFSHRCDTASSGCAPGADRQADKYIPVCTGIQPIWYLSSRVLACYYTTCWISPRVLKTSLSLKELFNNRFMPTFPTMHGQWDN